MLQHRAWLTKSLRKQACQLRLWLGWATWNGRQCAWLIRTALLTEHRNALLPSKAACQSSFLVLPQAGCQAPLEKPVCPITLNIQALQDHPGHDSLSKTMQLVVEAGDQDCGYRGCPLAPTRLETYAADLSKSLHVACRRFMLC